MKEEFVGSGWADFRQRYQGTYGWYEKDNGGRVLVNLVEISQRLMHFVDKAGMKYMALPDQGNSFTFIPVERGCYNYGKNDVVVTCRTPNRQYKRGICAENTSITSLSDGRGLSVGFDTLEKVFGEHPNFALSTFKKTLEGNCAFNRNFAIVQDGVFLYDKKIGSYSKQAIVLDEKLFKQEVEDVMVKNSLPITVSVV